MRNFKIKVTPEESEVIQKLLFLAGYTWGNGEVTVQHTDGTYYLYFNHKITYGINVNNFNNHNNHNITFEEFINEIELELNEKFQN